MERRWKGQIDNHFSPSWSRDYPSRFHLLSILLAGCLLCAFTACSQGNSAIATRTATSSPSQTTAAQQTATQPALPSGTVLYRADWTHGLSGWQVGHGWSIEQGVLAANTEIPSNLIVSYKPPVSQYAIEVSMQLVRVLPPGAGTFGIFAENAPGEDGYQGGVIRLAKRPGLENPNAYAGFEVVIANSFDSHSPFEIRDYAPGANYRTYRIEVQGDEVRLFIDGTLTSISRTTKEAISNGPLGLTAAAIQLHVKSFVITAL